MRVVVWLSALLALGAAPQGLAEPNYQVPPSGLERENYAPPPPPPPPQRLQQQGQSPTAHDDVHSSSVQLYVLGVRPGEAMQ